MTAPVENLSRAIYADLRQQLILGQLAPGAQLSIRTLAEDFGTSAMPVREALRQLASEQALIGAVKKAYRVPDLAPSEAANLFFIRSILEGAAGELAVAHMTDDDLFNLARLSDDTKAAWAAGDARAYIASNVAFHSAINARAKNPDLQALIDGIYARTGPWLAHGVTSLIAEDRLEDGHARIVDACHARDGKAVRRLVEADAQWAVRLFQPMA